MISATLRCQPIFVYYINISIVDPVEILQAFTSSSFQCRFHTYILYCVWPVYIQSLTLSSYAKHQNIPRDMDLWGCFASWTCVHWIGYAVSLTNQKSISLRLSHKCIWIQPACISPAHWVLHISPKFIVQCNLNSFVVGRNRDRLHSIGGELND